MEQLLSCSIRRGAPNGASSAPSLPPVQPPQKEASEPRRAPQRLYLAVPYLERKAAKTAEAKWDSIAQSWYAGPQADMKQLKRWLPENVKSEQLPAMTPREEFAEALRSVGCIVEGEHPLMDGGHIESGRKAIGGNLFRVLCRLYGWVASGVREE